MTYRTNAAPVPATRPALTRWQAVLTVTLGDLLCHRFAWFRAYIGGRWAFGPTSIDGRMVGAWMHFLDTPCGSGGVRRCEAGAMGTGCSCEVYPWPSLYSARTPDAARDFEEFRRWYEGVRVVDLSRVGKVTR